MPASELDWAALSPKLPIHQMFAMKRKADEELCVEKAFESRNEQINKRRCYWPEHAQQVPAQPMTEEANMEEVNHNDSSVNFNNNNNTPCTPPQMQAQPQVFQSLIAQSQPNRVPSPWPSDHSVHAHQNLYHPQYMDMTGETYTPVAVSRADSPGQDTACLAMDSDCVPNPQQYVSERHHHGKDSDYCRQFCGAGDESPTSGRVRCYCKPSWEGMMDLKPYISDYY